MRAFFAAGLLLHLNQGRDLPKGKVSRSKIPAGVDA
jgi:hypothetical protein